MVRDALCCVSLQKGTKIIAIFNLVACIFGVIFLGTFMGINLAAGYYLEGSLAAENNGLFVGNTTFSLESDNKDNVTDENSMKHFNMQILNKDQLLINSLDNNNVTTVFVNVQFLVLQAVQMGSSIYMVALFLVAYGIVLSHELLKGARKFNAYRCIPWLRAEIAGVIISLVMLPMTIIQSLSTMHTASLDWKPAITIGIIVTVLIAYLFHFYCIWVVHSFIRQLKRGAPNDSQLLNKNI